MPQTGSRGLAFRPGWCTWTVAPSWCLAGRRIVQRTQVPVRRGRVSATSSVTSAVGQSSTALWYFTRSAGLVALVALTASLVVGVIASIGWTTERWPRFLSQSVHRNLSLFCLGLVALHVTTTVVDGYVPIGFLDAFIPFRSPYRRSGSAWAR